MNLDLKGKRAVVCGSTQGIGREVALGLARLGCSITLVARNEEKLQKMLAALDVTQQQQHGYLVADFARAEEVKTAIEGFAVSQQEVHILINNTGGPAGGPITEASTEEFLQAFNNHLICNHILVQALLPLMKQARYGRIINIISTSVKQPLPSLGVSNAIRAAVANWAKTLSMEVAPFGITVNNVLPGSTRTGRLESLIKARAEKTGKSIAAVEEEMYKEIPMGRFAEAEEVANAAVFLATPAASYITGINIPVDGGRTGSL
jgi:3-oxoacyl-[acyl-carrier protein] reductase